MVNEEMAHGENPPGLELILEAQTKPRDPFEDLKEVARRVLSDHLPKWRMKTLHNAIFDYQIQDILPYVNDTSFRAKEDPSRYLLLQAAYAVLVEEGFEAVSGQWYIPDHKRVK